MVETAMLALEGNKSNSLPWGQQATSINVALQNF